MNFKVLRMAWCLLDSGEKRSAIYALMVSGLAAIMSGLMVLSVMPFLGVLADPESIHKNPKMSLLYHSLGFASDYDFLLALGALSLCVILLGTIAQLLRVYVLSDFSLMRMHSLSCRLLESYLRQSYSFFRNTHTGELGTQILNETQQVVAQFFRPIANMGAAIISILVLVGLLFWVNPVLTLACFALFSVIYGVTYYLIRRKLSQLGERRVESNKERFKIANEALGGIKDIKLLGVERAYLSRFQQPSYVMAKTQVIASVFGEMPSYVLQGVALGGMMVLVLVLLEPDAMDSGKTLAELIPLLGVFAFAGLRMIPELQRLYLGGAQVQFSAAAVRAIYHDLHGLERVEELPDTLLAPLELKKQIVVDHVTYRYSELEKAGLNDISITIPAGRKIGIVGTTGSGKTTLADLLLGLNRPQSGSIEIDGTEITHHNIRSWQRSIGYVPQDIFLIDATIAENIAMGVCRDSIDMERVREVSRVASLDGFIEGELAQGYDTVVGERGVKLSGGQRQRIGIARALYHNASFFVFDEATSALDNETEKEVMNAINALPGDKTILMIAHRLTTVRQCDEIIVLDKGSIVGHGSWDELCSTNKVFKRLVNAKQEAVHA